MMDQEFHIPSPLESGQDEMDTTQFSDNQGVLSEALLNTTNKNGKNQAGTTRESIVIKAPLRSRSTAANTALLSPSKGGSTARKTPISIQNTNHLNSFLDGSVKFPPTARNQN